MNRRGFFKGALALGVAAALPLPAASEPFMRTVKPLVTRHDAKVAIYAQLYGSGGISRATFLTESVNFSGHDFWQDVADAMNEGRV